MDGVELRKVTTRFGQSVVAVDAIALGVPQGSFVTLLGPSGSGKTTVADLLIGLLRPQKGDIEIDGVPLSQIDIRRWRGMIGYVPQENLLMHDTILKNVTLGEANVGEPEVESALRAAGAWDFVQHTPKDGATACRGRLGDCGLA